MPQIAEILALTSLIGGMASYARAGHLALRAAEDELAHGPSS
jgi:hypothetical protein